MTATEGAAFNRNEYAARFEPGTAPLHSTFPSAFVSTANLISEEPADDYNYYGGLL